MARFVHGESALDTLKLRLLKKVLMAAAYQSSTLQTFTSYVSKRIAAMNGRQFRSFRKDFVQFYREEIGVHELIARLDGKRPKPILYGQSDENYMKKIQNCIMDISGISKSK